MPQYIVHLYREMRLTFAGIEADTLEAAAAATRDRPTNDADDIEDCEGETLTALVDVAGDDEYEHSRFIDFEQETQRKAAPKLLVALEAVLPYAESEHESLVECWQRDGESVSELEAERCGGAIDKATAAIAAAKAAGITPAAAARHRPIQKQLTSNGIFHTPAAWEDNGNGLIYGQCSGDDDEAPFVADVCNDPNAYTDQEQANARLIVAAPALLTLAKQVVLAKDTEESVPVDLYNAAARVLATLETGEA